MTQVRVDWFEIPVTDLERAGRFYGECAASGARRDSGTGGSDEDLSEWRDARGGTGTMPPQLAISKRATHLLLQFRHRGSACACGKGGRCDRVAEDVHRVRWLHCTLQGHGGQHILLYTANRAGSVKLEQSIDEQVDCFRN